MDGITRIEAAARDAGPATVAISVAPDGRVLDLGERARSTFGELDQVFDIVHVDDLAMLATVIGDRGTADPFDLRLRSRSDTWLRLHVVVRATDDGVTIAGHDVTELRRTQARLAALREAVDHVAKRHPAAHTLDAAARLVESAWDDSRCAIFLCRGRDLELAAAPSMPAPWQRAAQRIIDAAPDTAERGALGSVPPVLDDISTQHGLRAGWCIPIHDRDVLSGVVTVFPAVRRFPSELERVVIEDAIALAALAIDRSRIADRVERAETFDALTGLLARPGFVAVLTEMLERHDRLSVLVVKVGGLAEVNVELGYEGGDVVLAAVAERVRRAIRGRDAAGRLAGGTFVIAGELRRSTESPAALAERLRRELAAPVAALGRRVDARVEIGWTEAMQGEEPVDVIRRAATGEAGPQGVRPEVRAQGEPVRTDK